MQLFQENKGFLIYMYLYNATCVQFCLASEQKKKKKKYRWVDTVNLKVILRKGELHL